MSQQGHTLTTRPSLFSISSHVTGAQVHSRPSRSNFRPCANCTCSPGLLTRQGRLSSSYSKRLSLRKSSSGKIHSPFSSPRRTDSLYTLDSENCNSVVRETNTTARLAKLREKMAMNDLGVYIVPSQDAHQSEYTSLPDQRMAFISGFSGSAGVSVVTRDISSLNETPDGVCALSTDGRYFTQALNELDLNWRLLKQGVKDEPTWEEWSIDQAAQMSADSGKEVLIGVDPSLITFAQKIHFQKLVDEKISNSKKQINIKFVPIATNLIDAIWTDFESYPERVLNPVEPLDLKYTGLSTREKLTKIQEKLLTEHNLKNFVVTSLDEIAWILNLRGSDIDYNPVFYSYLIISAHDIVLYIDNHERLLKSQNYLTHNKVIVKPYNQIWQDLSELSIDNDNKIAVSSTASWAIVNQISKSGVDSFKIISSPIEELKAIKSPVEIEGAKAAHYKDGIALCKFFSWLEYQVIHEGELIDEVEASDKLLEFRKEQPDFVGLSFETISSTGSNAAIIHYAPKKDNCSVIDPSKIYLNDSGSQFLDGTTDTTRTFHFGTPTQEQIDNYTLVLKGNIALATLNFPEGTTGYVIDSIARQYLWKYGLDYRHGTGHGVGAYLNVHEGPVGISFRPATNNVALKPGNLISNEPGYYKDGEYGIRIENVMYVTETEFKFGDKKFFKFETITRVPYCKKLINVNMLSKDEKDWINSYHQQVWNDISKNYKKHSIEYNWLKNETSVI
ncbi:hypothetical protein PACTADRAFT_51492 [Pachysolen tannophilus NRRL Y-2460]|uniref:Xaa-Pro aminopeptidase n=1 Tax=Pachysolen tannophilus NRRL Y-2460 TaxID=669874 RepID=A0A1E4TPQ2_PACTA|nr:hypothetical protein PACTADRAFT_51492 [Pachysolen tannophilus NRRL Y-2460]